MNESDVYIGLTKIFEDVFFREGIELRPEFTAKDIAEWDSFKQVEIILEVEERFGVSFNSREIDALRCVGDISQLILRKLA